MKLRSIMLFTALLASPFTYADQIVLITNKASAIKSVSERDALNIYLGKKSKWDDGTPVVPFTQENGDITEAFTQEYVKKSANQFALYWRKAIFTGTGTPPDAVSDSKAMKASVAARVGTIGYILESELDDSVARVEVL